MKKPEIARRLARQSGVSKAEAADQLDRVVHDILAQLRKGEAAPLPGLGHFTPGPKGIFQFEKEPGRARKRRPRARR
jgi:nucleoid DNA-binding protein